MLTLTPELLAEFRANARIGVRLFASQSKAIRKQAQVLATKPNRKARLKWKRRAFARINWSAPMPTAGTASMEAAKAMRRHALQRKDAEYIQQAAADFPA